MFQSPTKFNISFLCTVLTELTLDSSNGKYNRQSIHISFLPDQGISWILFAISECILFFHFVFFFLNESKLTRMQLHRLCTSCSFLLRNCFTLYIYATSECFVIRYAEQLSMAWSMFFKLGFGHPDIFFFARYHYKTLMFSCLCVSTWHGLILRVC